MDPNANLKEMLEVARLIEREGRGEAEEQGEYLAELVLALDGWLTKGGFLPERWQRKEGA